MTPATETIFEACARLSGICQVCNGTGTVVHCHDPDCQADGSCHHPFGEIPCPECGEQ